MNDFEYKQPHDVESDSDVEYQHNKVLTIAVLVVVVAVFAWFGLSVYKQNTEEKETKRQTQELDALRAQTGREPFTQEELDIQSSALDELHKTNQTVVDTDAQKNELDVLRQGSHQ